MTREVECPACGAIIIGPDDYSLVAKAREHTLDAHGYLVPSEHVLDQAVPGRSSGPAAPKPGRRIEISDLIELQTMLARYGTVIDMRDWDSLGLIFTEDVRFDISDIGRGIIDGIDNLRSFMANNASHPQAHLITNIFPQALQGDTGIMRSRVLAVQKDGSVAVGAYVDDVVRTESGWRIKNRTFTYQYRPKNR